MIASPAGADISSGTVFNGTSIANEVTITKDAQGEIVASGSCGDSASWTLNDMGDLVISGTGEIGYCGWDRDSVITLTVEEGITGIGEDVRFAETRFSSLKQYSCRALCVPYGSEWQAGS